MAKYRIFIDRKLPDDEQIAKHQNFDALLRQFEAQPQALPDTPLKPRRLWGWSAAAAGVVLVLGTWWAVGTGDDSVLEDTKGTSDRGVLVQPDLRLSPVSPEAELAGEARLRLADGASAQVLYSWEKLQAPIVGAPGASQQLVLASEGPFPEKGVSFEIRMPAGKTPVIFQERNGWKALTGKSKASPVYPKPGQPVLAPVPVDPPKAPKQAFAVKLSHPEDYPEFKAYENTYWEYLPEAGSVDPWKEGLVGETNAWEDVRAVRKQGGRFHLIFSRTTPEGGMITRQVIARPLFDAHSLDAANAMLNARNTEYLQALARWKAEEESRDSTYQEQLKTYQTNLRLWQSTQNQPREVVWTWELREPGRYLLAE